MIGFIGPSSWKAFFAMIYNDKFVWLHLPKTGGTTVHNLFKDMGSQVFMRRQQLQNQTRLSRTT